MNLVERITGLKLKSGAPSGIYKIYCKSNKKAYIGSTYDFYERFYDHIHKLINKKHANTYLQNAVNKYGIEEFEFSIIQECSLELLLPIEIYWIEFFNSEYFRNGFNIEYPDIKGGKKMSEETKEKIRQFNLGKKQTEEHKRKKRENNPWTVHTKESKEKISKANKGKKRTQEFKNRMSELRAINICVLDCNENLLGTYTTKQIYEIYKITPRQVWLMTSGNKRYLEEFFCIKETDYINKKYIFPKKKPIKKT